MDDADLAVSLAENVNHNQKDSTKIPKGTILFPHRNDSGSSPRAEKKSLYIRRGCRGRLYGGKTRRYRDVVYLHSIFSSSLHENVWVSRSIAPRILDFVTGWR
jgi:hypothetical protein